MLRSLLSFPRGGVMRILESFSRSQNGNFAVWAALAALPVLGGAGMATSYTLALLEKGKLQQALDAAVLAGTTLSRSATEADRIAVAESLIANLNSKFGKGEELSFLVKAQPVNFTTEGTSVIGLGRIEVPNLFGGLIGPDFMTIEVTAMAEKRSSKPICLHALNSKAPRSLEIYGNATLDAQNCAVMVNSESSEGIKIYGAKSSASALEFGLTGSYSGNNITPAPMTDIEPLEDVYAKLPVPKPGPCIDVGNKLSKDEITLEPGTYCGGLNISPKASVTLNPGIYIMLDGQLSIGANSRVEGKEVMIAFVGTDSYIYTNSGTELVLSSPKTGVYTNVQMMSDRKLMGSWKGGEEWATISASTLELDGVLHLPEQDVWIKGGSSVKVKTVNMAMVADQFWIQDGSTVTVWQENTRNLSPEFGQAAFQHSARLAQ